VTTQYHAKYFAHELTRRRPSDAPDRLSQSLFDATVDLNPHQIDAASFALRSPLSSGVILADEVGLGKTIEAGLVLCQLWAERRRRLLVICPASLRKQWSLELQEKFHLPTLILDARTVRERSETSDQALPTEAVLIMSINFASVQAERLREIPWDLVTIDEAHKLRNAYRPSNRMGRRLRWALEGRRKLLLTATPLQNSLLELYGLATVIDEQIFGDRAAFREQYMHHDGDLRALRARLQPFCKRTLRKQVLEYISYTERRTTTVPFTPTDSERALYDDVSEFLSRDDTFSVPSRQRTLVTLILRKLLGSSSRAIAATLETMRERLVRARESLAEPASREAVATFAGLGGPGSTDDVLAELTVLEDLEEDYLDEELVANADEAESEQSADVMTEPRDRTGGVLTEDVKATLAALDAEIAELDGFIERARGIAVDTKSTALLRALEIGFGEMEKMGAARKAVVFTESRRTQEYVRDFLEANGYEGKVVVFSGANSGPQATAVYEAWREANRDSGRVTGSRVIDIRTALIEHFRDAAEIMVATEAAAEGVNLQFCSLVINYDLPWNPMVVEQRIGRIDRFGQESEVVNIHNLVVEGTVEDCILYRLYDRIGLFRQSIGDLEEVLGETVRELQRDYVSGRLTPEEADARVEQAANAINRRRTQTEELEKRAGELFGHEEYIRDEMARVNRLGRYVSEEAMLAVIRNFLQTSHPSAGIWEERAGVYGIRLTEGLRGDLQDAAQGTQFWMDRSRDDQILITTQGEIAFRNPDVELVNVSHPIVRAAVKALTRQLETPVARVGKATVDLPSGEDTELGAGDYYAVVFAHQVEGIRARRVLETVVWSGASGGLVDPEAGERLLHLGIEQGIEWDSREPAPALPKEAWCVIESEVRRRNRVLLEQERRENEALYARRKRALEAEYTHDREVKETRLRTARARGREERILRAFEGQLRKADSDYRDKVGGLEQMRAVSARLSEPAAACLIRVRRE